MPEFEIRSIPQQHTAAIALSTPMAEIGEAMSTAFPAIFHAVTAAGATPVGPPLARYFVFGEPTIEFECAIPLAAPFSADGEVKPSSVGAASARKGWGGASRCPATMALGQGAELPCGFVGEQEPAQSLEVVADQHVLQALWG